MDDYSWLDLLEQVASLTRSDGAALVVTAASQAFVWLDTPADDEPTGRQPCAHAWAAVEVDTALAIGPPDALATPLFDRRAFAREVWFDSAVAAAPGGDRRPRRRVIVGVQRRLSLGSYAAAEIDAFNLVLPHFALAIETRARLQAAMRQATLATIVLDRLALPVFLLDGQCRIVHANAAAAALAEPGRLLSLRHDRLSCCDGDGGRALAVAVRRVAEGAVVDAPVVIEGADGAVARLWLTGVRASAPACTSPDKNEAMVLVLVQRNGQRGAADATRLCGLFALAPAEARLARALLDGETLADYALRVGISEGTARWTLKQVFQKTRTTRQAELVHLLATSPVALFR